MRRPLFALALFAVTAASAGAQEPADADAFRAAYPAEPGPSFWTASVHIGIRYKQGMAISPRIPSDTVITGLPTKDACLAAGRMIAAQKTEVPSLYNAQGSVLCLDLGTGDSAEVPIAVED